MYMSQCIEQKENSMRLFRGGFQLANEYSYNH